MRWLRRWWPPPPPLPRPDGDLIDFVAFLDERRAVEYARARTLGLVSTVFTVVSVGIWAWLAFA